MSANENQKLRELIGEAIENWGNDNGIQPSWLANAVYKRIDCNDAAPNLVKLAALLHLRQVARAMLRNEFEKDNIQQHELFPDLQIRYPIAHTNNDEPTYVRLEHLSSEDIHWNIRRLRMEASTKMKHADALEAWAITHKMIAS